MSSEEYHCFTVIGKNSNFPGTATTPINTREFFNRLAKEGYNLPPQAEEELSWSGSHQFPDVFALSGFENNAGKRPEDLVSRLQEHEGIVLEYQGTFEEFNKKHAYFVSGGD